MNKSNKSRYNLHYSLKQKGFEVISKDRTVVVYHDEVKDKQILKLQQKYGYNIQIAIKWK